MQETHREITPRNPSDHDRTITREKLENAVPVSLFNSDLELD